MSGDNDADKRPRIYGRKATKDGVVEVTVQGSEGESVDDIEDVFDDKVSSLSEVAMESDDDETERGVR